VNDTRSRDTQGIIDLQHLAEELGRPIKTLKVLNLDPFYIEPARRAEGEWFGDIWQRFNIKPGAHIRRIHYFLVSQETPITTPNGDPYLNTDDCYMLLNKASQVARYMGLVDSADLIDRRNDEPIINREDIGDYDASIFAIGRVLNSDPPGFTAPQLTVNPPRIEQRYHLEIWCEKSTMDDVLSPLGERYDINLVRGVGEMSVTRCRQLVDRAEESGRPVRILYLSDFDPAGNGMPVAAARKIEHTLYQRGLHDLDIQVRPIFLTHEQCVQYRLPRTPIKEGDRRATHFESRFGEGATELDALEALHPGVLRRILQKEISRYYDHDLSARINEVRDQITDELHTISSEVHERHADALAELESERQKVIDAIEHYNETVRPILETIRHAERAGR
jgi:hypothetical protein